MKRYLVLVVLIGIVGVGFIAFQQYNKKHDDLSIAKVDYKVSAIDLFNEYNTNESSADKKYLGKTIEVYGKISNIDKENASAKIYLDTEDLMSSVMCEMDEKADISDLNEGDVVSLRGVLAGSLMDVVLNRCILIEKK